MLSNKKKILAILSLLLIFGVVVNFSKKEIKKDDISIKLSKIYPNSKIEISGDPYVYKINMDDFYVKIINIGETKLLLVVENYKNQGTIYRFYSSDGDVLLLKEVNSFLRSENSKQIFNDNLFEKDITGDNIPEIFLRVEDAQSGGTSYEVFRWDKDSLVNIKLEGQKDNWVGFDSIDYKDGYIYTTWHAVDATGKTQYELKDNVLTPIKNIGYFHVQDTEDDCEVKQNKVYDEFIIIKKEKCSVLGNNFDQYFK